MPKELRYAMTWLFLGTLGCIVSYFFLDKPIAFWVFNHQYNHILFFKKATFIPVIVVVIAVLIYAWLVFCFSQDRYRTAQKTALLIVNSVAVTYFLKSALKVLFARYWPMTWIHHNPSLISDGVYGFNWLHVGSAYGAFPSGHSAVMAAAMVALSLRYPKTSWLFALLWGFVAVGLVGTNSHFLGDVIGGATLGGFVACCTCYTLQFSPAKNIIRHHKSHNKHRKIR
jgi:membrane-associated phospholipid phosphatase